MYVVNMESYRSSRAALGEVWRRLMGRHYPAMAVVEVTGLYSPAAMLEIEATAVLP
jgi:enamine deaminase RidA (YjgF/YER057c/UK114 family)